MSQGLSETELAELREVFELMDKDKGGSLGVDEIKALMDMLGMKMRMEDVEAMVAEIDNDGSGEVEFDEFVKVMTNTKELPYAKEDVTRAFKMLSPPGTGEGVIARADLEKALLHYVGATVGEDEVMRLLSGLEQDEHGMIDYAAKIGAFMQ